MIQRLVKCVLAVAVMAGLPLAGSSMSQAVASPQLMVGAPTVTEGAAATTTTVQVPLTLSAASAAPVAWRWTTFDQPDFVNEERPATPGADYVATGGVVTFAPGQTTAQVPVTVLGDALAETNEFVALVFVRDTDPIDVSTLVPSMIHIVEDDQAPKVLAGEAIVLESDGPGTVMRLPVTLSGPSGLPVTVQWTTLFVSGLPFPEALAPGDYTATSGSVTFAPMTTSATVAIPITADNVAEAGEVVVVSFHNPTGATIGGFYGLGFGVIFDDD
jgi:hypothetical protein